MKGSFVVANPNNCATCEHKNRTVDEETVEGHCYMFRDEPNEVCMQHTARKVAFVGKPTPLALAGILTALIEVPAIDEPTKRDGDVS